MVATVPALEDSHRRARSGTVSGRAIGWLSMLAMIEMEVVNNRHLRAHFECSRSTITRYLQDVEQVYGVVVEYVRPERIGRGGGWYEIRDWGVLNKDAVVSRYQDSRSMERVKRRW